MSKAIKVGITGGIGSGKSIVCQVFAKLGVPIYNSDERAKFLTKTNPHIRSQIKNTFGTEYFDTQGQLLAQKLGSLVFTNEDKLKALNNIVHPLVADDFKAWLEHQNSPYILKESAIIFENGIERGLDKVISVVSPLELRIKNIIKRDPYRTENSIMAIVDKQMSDTEKASRSDFVIYNDEQSLMIHQILTIHESILQIWKTLDQ